MFEEYAIIKFCWYPILYTVTEGADKAPPLAEKTLVIRHRIAECLSCVLMGKPLTIFFGSVFELKSYNAQKGEITVHCFLQDLSEEGVLNFVMDMDRRCINFTVEELIEALNYYHLPIPPYLKVPF